jgi:hypothetical protein
MNEEKNAKLIKAVKKHGEQLIAVAAMVPQSEYTVSNDGPDLGSCQWEKEWPQETQS